GDGGDQITKSSVSSIQAASIWATTPCDNKNGALTGRRFYLLITALCYFYAIFVLLCQNKRARS
ncbi:hypothetical protein ACLHZ0_17635, partial [Aeromonas salmonicida]|uniref:hypothetical protein n=1 Tax=Aeromonas salmonicida TaxID=645 RepID=UPI003D034D4C